MASRFGDFLIKGVSTSGVSVQGHLHGNSFDALALENELDWRARLKLPVRVTEFAFPGQRSKYYRQRGVQRSAEEEQARAQALADYCCICFVHLAVERILRWGFWERANWIPLPALYQRDWSPTPAAEAYRDLEFRQWWRRWRRKADGQGHCELRARFPKHRVTASGREKWLSSKGRSQSHRLHSQSQDGDPSAERTRRREPWNSLAEDNVHRNRANRQLGRAKTIPHLRLT